MARVLVAALVALIISLLAGPVFIDFLRRHALGQHDPRGGARAPLGQAGHADDGRRADRDRRDDRVPRDQRPHAAGAHRSSARRSPAAAIGFLDDLIKLRHRRSLGLSGRVEDAAAARDRRRRLRRRAPPAASATAVFIPIVDQHAPARLGLVRARLPDHRRRRERREPHRRPRRARRRARRSSRSSR